MKLISGEHVGALAMSEPNGNLCDNYSVFALFIDVVEDYLAFLYVVWLIVLCCLQLDLMLLA
jgi:hypothetical protein